MSRFEDNLWREVESKYGSELSETGGPLQRRSRPRVPMIAGTSLGIVGAGAAAVIVLTAASSSPAFAVTRNPDGTVSVVIRRIEGIPGANLRLAQLGIRARAVRVAGACQVATPPALAQVTVATLVRGRHPVWVGTNGEVNARIRPTQIPIGRTLVIPAVRNGALVRLVHGRAVRGAVPACLRPAVLIRSASGRADVRIIACRGGIVLSPRPVAPSQGTNPTSTSASPAPSTATGTTTGPGTTTTGPGTTTTGPGTTTTGHGTTTNTGTALASTNTTESAATTSGGTATTLSPAAPPSTELPPPLVRACLQAARAQAR
jgi:hypothetical protein